ncbi:alpha-amylase/4-alpha-glucanotransferase domain-containing protein [Marinithermus hydrothermalis]|uniref:4-alpha-glucanotransferase n=1 Tax=Marinithermus hydrothermalis (strain DSM 14884 / JCM 11576 / T1) TaxID=869210 RepID=F2NMK1_MARHT|nr:alpha-amylase/4-alpha-glucanotransferase domain-containing protein [Marinithermus hydrothermalis]AEB12171.1 4-alpha-glucanotransferase [Marinithermus hydrothermalis DSM 14884]
MARLALILHHHQPYGAPSSTYAAAYESTYRPILEVIERTPQVHVLLHYSGSLLDWLEAHHPEFLERVAQLAAQNRVEVLGGALYEAVLPLLPERDVEGQLEDMAERVEEVFGVEALGAWLPERVWEPCLARALTAAGYRYTLLDELAFTAAGLPPQARVAPVITGHDTHLLRVYPITQALSAALCGSTSLPELPPEGLWVAAVPAESVRCIQRLERTLREALDSGHTWVLLRETLHAPAVRAYLPAAAHLELERQALPPETQARWLQCRELLGEAATGVMRGAPFHNFLSRYPQALDLWAKMRYVSEKVEETKRPPEEAYRALYRAQAADAFWPAASGGVYRPEIRIAAWRALIEAENACEPRKYAWLEIEQEDIDQDGEAEIIAESHTLNLYFRPRDGGSLFALDVREVAWPLLAAMVQPPEPQIPAPGLPTRSLFDFVWPDTTDLEAFLSGDSTSLAGFHETAFQAAKYRDRITLSAECTFQTPEGTPVQLGLRKTVRVLHRDETIAFEWRLANLCALEFHGLYATNLHFAAPTPATVALEVDGAARPVETPWVAHDATRACWRNAAVPLEACLEFGSRPAALWHYPIQARAPQQKAAWFQGFGWMLVFPLSLSANRSRRFRVTLRLRHG